MKQLFLLAAKLFEFKLVKDNAASSHLLRNILTCVYAHVWLNVRT